MTIRDSYSLLLALTLLAGTLYTSLSRAEAPDATRTFEIELLVFQNLVVNDGGEIWPIDYSEWFQEDDEEQTGDNAVTQEIDWLPEQAWRLTAERNALGHSARYRPIAYFAWRQAVLDRARAVPIELPVENDSAGKTYVGGSVRVAVERYLHLYLDLQLHTPVNDEQMELLEYDIPEFRLSEHRRMRSGEIHYFDNPRFGVIALITPYEPPPAQETAPAADAAEKPAQPQQPR
ncbi:MAG: CsiV family protein [Thiogranum sp.]